MFHAFLAIHFCDAKMVVIFCTPRRRLPCWLTSNYRGKPPCEWLGPLKPREFVPLPSCKNGENGGIFMCFSGVSMMYTTCDAQFFPVSVTYFWGIPINLHFQLFLGGVASNNKPLHSPKLTAKPPGRRPQPPKGNSSSNRVSGATC